MASVVFEHVYKKYKGNVTAINDLNLEIEDKEFLVLVGPSGCGKTTALRCLAGLEEVTSGNVLIGGRIVNNVEPKDRDIAMVFQSYALYPHMSVFDNMAFGLKMRKVDKEEINRRVQNAAQILEIGHLLERKPRELSGGQRQRVAVGRAIVREPQVFLFDEPLSNLDAKLRVAMRAEIIKLHNQLNTTFIYVTHDQLEAMTMATRIAVMNKGILQQLDTPHELYARPENQFVAGFIGSPAMNFFPAKVTQGDGSLYIDTQHFHLQIPENRAKPYAEYVEKPVILGIRPEDIYSPQFTPPGIIPSETECTVEVTEMMGNEIFLYLIAGDSKFVARVDPRSSYKAGERVKLIFNMANMHLFDPGRDAENPPAIV